MKKLHIGLVYNAYLETSHNTPLVTDDVDALKKSISHLARMLRRLGHKVTIIPLSNDLFLFQRKIFRIKPDVIFNQYEDVVQGAIYEMRLAAMMQMMGFPMTGSPAIALGLCRYKYMSALLLQGAGIPIPLDTRILELISDVDRHKWTFPLIVQPEHEHAGVGLDRDSVIYTKKSLRDKVRELLRAFNQPVIVQRFLPGREFNVSVIGGNKMRVLPLAEVCYRDLPEDIPPIMSYPAKWLTNTIEYKKIYVQCPADVKPELAKKIEETAYKAFRTIGGWGYGRVDIRLDESGTPCVLEVNCNPFLENGVGIARSAARAGFSFPQLLDLILKSAFEKKPFDVTLPMLESRTKKRKI